MNKKLIKPHLDILPAAQKSLWPHLAATQHFGMVLYGGTAIALHLGHRTSVDFDFFTHRTLDKRLIRLNFPFVDTARPLQNDVDTYSVAIPVGKDEVQVSFFGGIRFGRVGVPCCTEDDILQIASLDDLMATKLAVLSQRVESKDYIDIAAMLKSGVSLERGLSSAMIIYGNAFQPSECLKALVYFEGGDLKKLNDETKEILMSGAESVRDLPAVNLLSTELAIPQISCSKDRDLER